jgi:aldehyde:ferredoxin oxidoreductase
MESKGLEFSEYVTKESLAMQGGYGLTLKGPQHDEAWLIFMDMVNNAIPTFQRKQKHYIISPCGELGLVLMDYVNYHGMILNRQIMHRQMNLQRYQNNVKNYVDIFNAVTGWDVNKQELINQSERCYNWQRAMNVWLGRGTRKDDWIPYRSMGPVTPLEYVSRKNRYDTELMEKLDIKKEEVDKKLQWIMSQIHSSCVKYGKDGNFVNYVKGANIAGL